MRRVNNSEINSRLSKWLPMVAYCQKLTICPFIHLFNVKFQLDKNRPWLTVTSLISPGNCPYTGPDAAMMNSHSYIHISQSSPDPNLQSQSHTDDAVRSLPSGSSLPTCAAHSFLLHAAFSLHHLQLSASLLITNDRLHMLVNRPPARVSF